MKKFNSFNHERLSASTSFSVGIDDHFVRNGLIQFYKVSIALQPKNQNRL